MEDNTIQIDLSSEAFAERYELVSERIALFPGELKGAAADYFTAIKDIARICYTERTSSKHDRAVNEALYRELTDEGFESSFLNIDYASERFGGIGTLLSAWYAEFRGIIPFTYENRLKDITVILETVMQLYCAFEEHAADTQDDDTLSAELSEIIYSYIYDYTDEFVADYIARECDPSYSFARDIVMQADLDNIGEDSYLYAYGEYITEEELCTARLLSELSEEQIESMAKAYTEGYIKGFEMTGKDIGLKSTVSCYLPVGFERFMRAAIRQFEAAGLTVIINRNPVHLINKKNNANIKPGFYGASNRTCDFWHKEDLALFWGDKLKARKTAALKLAYEACADRLKEYSGHACVEIFGRSGETPRQAEHAARYNEHQQKALREYAFKAHEIAQQYMPDEETSFTIIAWPTPSIADTEDKQAHAERMQRYREIFECFIDINTLPVDEWQQIQQHIIDALDSAEYVEVKGADGNDTDIRIRLHTLNDPDTETNFENCLADVNIPAGEVFTSPVLKGTNGILHAGYVYIGGFLFKDLRIEFTDGRVTDYSCANYEDADEGRRLIEHVIFKDREQLPMGECAIGTNTAAYAAALRYHIADKMPVLIAEKTGPHFAVGDTCYSYEEDMITCNPDGKRITARENECSMLRHSNPEQAYFGVHTDITLPYDELSYINAVSRETVISIIRDGRFVLAGTEVLNEALDR